MSATVRRWCLGLLPLAGLLVWATLPAAGQGGQVGARNGEWTTYGGDLANTRYAALDQINAGNFDKLQIAWRFKTENLVRARNAVRIDAADGGTASCTRPPARAVPLSRSTRRPVS